MQMIFAWSERWSWLFFRVVKCRQTVRQKKLDLINVKAKPTDRVVKPTKICCRLYFSRLHCEHNVTYFYYYNASDYIMSTIMWSSAAFFLRFPLETDGEKRDENYNFSVKSALKLVGPVELVGEKMYKMQTYKTVLASVV